MDRCRTCLSNSIDEYCSVLDFIQKTDVTMISYLKLINILTQKEKLEDDILPKCICSACRTFLLDVYDFKLRCEASQKYFEELLAQEEKNVQTDYDVKVEDTEESYEDVTVDLLHNDENSLASEIKPFDVDTKIKYEPKGLKKRGRKRGKLKREKEHECQICNKKYIHTAWLKAHLLTHKDKYYCELCKNYYASEKSHVYAKHRECSFFCNDCGKGFGNKTRLLSHILAKHTNFEARPKYKCNVDGCSKTFVSKCGLYRHGIYHKGVKSYLCEICSKSFLDKGGLLMHNETHMPNRCYPCRICSKKMNSRTSRKRHELTHGAMRMHPCPICSKEFSEGHKLRRHMLVHGERQFKCSYCSKEFYRQDQLKTHILKDHSLNVSSTQDLSLIQSFSKF